LSLSRVEALFLARGLLSEAMEARGARIPVSIHPGNSDGGHTVWIG
jgi:hypothetical protein